MTNVPPSQGPRSLKEALLAPFKSDGTYDRPLIALFLAINFIVLTNAIIHDPAVNYDAARHVKCIDVWADGRIPTRLDTKGFYYAPLAYLPPAALRALRVPRHPVLKIAQLLNVLYSAGLTWFLLNICQLLRRDDVWLKRLSLFLLGLIPLYYKTFAYVRPEPLLSFLGVLLLWHAVRALVLNSGRWSDFTGLGIVAGLVMIARQWGFFLFPAVAFLALGRLAFGPSHRTRMLTQMASSAAIALLLGGWFYLNLFLDHGTISPMHKPDRGFHLSNYPSTFYAALSLPELFSDPVRPSLDEKMWPLFYSSLWGDYECYWLVHLKDADGRLMRPRHISRITREDVDAGRYLTNRYSVAPYLGRVNLLSVLPSAIMAAGTALGALAFCRWIAARGNDQEAGIMGLLALAILGTAAGLLYYVVSRRVAGANQPIKATYVLQMFPLAAVLASAALTRLGRASPAVLRVLLVLLAGVAIHNSRLFFTGHADPMLSGALAPASSLGSDDD